MQTFLPYADFNASAACLDNARLGKQRVEARQILNTLEGWSVGWRKHPATRMWAGHVPVLARYGIAVCTEWKRRGFRDSLLEVFQLMADSSAPDPWWLGCPQFHLSHQSNLVRKDLDRYGALWPGIPSTLPYLWPIPDSKQFRVGLTTEFVTV